MALWQTTVDELAFYDDLLADKQFWKDFEEILSERLGEKFLPIWMAGATAGARLQKRAVRVKEFDENEPRDEQGRWTDSGGGGERLTNQALRHGAREMAEEFRSSWGRENPLDSSERISGNAIVSLTEVTRGKTGTDLHDHPYVYLAELRSTSRGSIDVIRAMHEITAMADRHGAVIDLLAKPFGSGQKLSSDDLILFYEHFGFQRVSAETTRMVRWPLSSGKKEFDPDQPRDERGQWADSGGGGGDGERAGGGIRDAVGEVTARQQANAEKWLAEEHITPAMITENLRASLDAATPSERAEGMVWYDNAHETAVGLGERYGVTTEQAAGVLAALSPQADWETVNIPAADRLLAIANEKTYTLSERDIEKRYEASKAIAMRYVIDRETMLTRAEEIRSLSREWVGSRPMGEVPTEILALTKPVGVSSQNAEKGFRIARGEDPVKVLSERPESGFKVRSFYSNIADPKGSKETTIDNHMINAALGRLTNRKEAAPVFMAAAKYAVVRDSVRAVSGGLRPSQTQAIIWIHQRNAFSTHKTLDVDEMDDVEYANWLMFDLIWQGWSDMEAAQIVLLATEKDFDEDLHPRDEAGRFTESGGNDLQRMTENGAGSLRQACVDFETIHSGDKRESGLIVHSDGVREMITSGREDVIELSDKQIESLKGAAFTHNHPINGAPLSWADVGVGIKGDAAEMRSVSKDGYVSALLAPKGSWKNAPGGIEEAYAEAVSPRVVFGAMRADGQKEINDFLNESWKKLAEKTGATYTFVKAYRSARPSRASQPKIRFIMDEKASTGVTLDLDLRGMSEEEAQAAFEEWQAKLNRATRSAEKDWNEEDHPRDEIGRFTFSAAAASESFEKHEESIRGAVDRLRANHGTPVKVTKDELPSLMERIRSEQISQNLETVSVSGASGLYSEHLREIPRSEMPQLPETVEGLHDFNRYMEENGIGYRIEEIDPCELTATQNELDSLKVASIAGAMAKEGGLRAGSVLAISRDSGVIDGHHRWAASATHSVTHPETKITVIRYDADIDKMLKLANAYKGVEHEGLHAAVDSGMKRTEEIVAGKKEKAGWRYYSQGERPTEPPPDAFEPWVWLGGKWRLLLTDGDMPKKMSFDVPVPLEEKEFNEEDHPRDADGRFTWAGEGTAAGELASEIRKQGGFTYQPITHIHPDTGKMVSRPGHEKQFKGMATALQIKAYLDANAVEFKDPDAYAGGWFNPEDKTTYLDISERYETDAEAKQASIEAKQEAYYDLATGETTYVRARDKENHGNSLEEAITARPQENAARPVPPGDDTRRDSGHDRRLLGDGRAGGIWEELRFLLKDFNEEDHPRDEAGRFTFSEGGGGSPALRESLRRAENNIRSGHFESAIALDKDGKLIFETGGDHNSVTFTEGELARLEGSTLTHNHPEEYSFSKVDIETACKYRLTEIRAVTPKGKTYSIKPKDGKWMSSLEFSIRLTAAATQQEAIDKRLMRAGRLSIDEANKRYHDKLWSENQDYLGIVYTVRQK